MYMNDFQTANSYYQGGFPNNPMFNMEQHYIPNTMMNNMGSSSTDMYNQPVCPYSYEYMNYNMMPGMPNSMNNTSQFNRQLDNMYPEVYRTIYPMVTKSCDTIGNNMYSQNGMISENTIDEMVDNIYSSVIPTSEVREDEVTDEFRSSHRSLSKDLIRILLIRELLYRRRW